MDAQKATRTSRVYTTLFVIERQCVQGGSIQATKQDESVCVCVYVSR
jgi:hypothetical protein